jgi:hypothetical protein
MTLLSLLNNNIINKKYEIVISKKFRVEIFDLIHVYLCTYNVHIKKI